MLCILYFDGFNVLFIFRKSLQGVSESSTAFPDFTTEVDCDENMIVDAM